MGPVIKERVQREAGHFDTNEMVNLAFGWANSSSGSTAFHVHRDCNDDLTPWPSMLIALALISFLNTAQWRRLRFPLCVGLYRGDGMRRLSGPRVQ